jgi:hypothetical protein
MEGGGFDDPEVELSREPFVSGIPHIIEKAAGKIPDAGKGFVAVFSASRFPGYDVGLDLMHEESGGGWYRWEKTGQEGWLFIKIEKAE